MRCNHARGMMTRELREMLSPEQARGLEAHLERCPGCRSERGRLRGFESLLLEAAAHRVAVPRVIPDRAVLRAHLPVRRPGERRRSAAWAALALGAAACGAVTLRPGERPGERAAAPVRTPDTAVGAGPSSTGRQPGGTRAPRRGPSQQRGGSADPLLARRDPPARPAQLAGRRSPYPEAGPPPVQDDERYLNAADGSLIAGWMTGDPSDSGVREWLGRTLPPVKDDFVEVPLPRLASARPDRAAVQAALQKYAQEAAVVDSRLFRRVSLRLKASPLSELCDALEAQTGVRFAAARGLGDENVTVFVKERPARELMREVARLFGYRWARSGEENAYRYELYQELKAQLAEEEMRSRDRHAALVALDEQMQGYAPYLRLSAAEARERWERAQGAEKKLLAGLLDKGWGVVQVYARLSPAQKLALAEGTILKLATNAASPDLRIPEELRRPLLENTRFTLGTFEGEPALVDRGFGQPGTPLADIPDAFATVTLSIERSELGHLKLNGYLSGGLESNPEIKTMFWAGGAHPASAVSPSVAKPENALLNAKLKETPALARPVTVKPSPSCPWFDPETRPKDRGGFEVKVGNGNVFIGPDGQLAKDHPPHVSSADVWEAIHDATRQPIVADAYSRVHPVKQVTVEGAPLFDALCRIGDEMGVRWSRDGEFLLARSTSFYWDKLKEVPARHLRRWREHLRRDGKVPLGDVLEMSTLSDAQLDSKVVGYVIGHCWGLEEWGIAGAGGAFRVGLPGGAYLRPYLRFLYSLTAGQRERALRPGGLAASELSVSQQETLARVISQTHPDVRALAGLQLRIEYAPVGSFLWHPVAETRKASEELAGVWLGVVGDSVEAALARARRLNPAATEEEIRKSRGAVLLIFRNAEGHVWEVGGPGVAFRSTGG